MKFQTGSVRARRTAIRLLRWYPGPWRVRYEREMRALLTDMPVGWRQVANIAGTAARQWVSPRAFGWPARSAAGRLQIVRGVMFFAIAYGLYAIARLIGWRLRVAGYDVNESLEIVAAVPMLAFAIRVFVTGFFRLRKLGRMSSMRRPSAWGHLSDKEIIVWGALMMPSLILRNAAPPPSYLSDTMVTLQPYLDLLQIFVWLHISFESSKLTQRLRRVHTRHLTRRPLGIGPTLGLGD